ncbi:MAG: ATP-binding cassette domain-containing protein [Bacteroidetes bacterium]|nr:ATP-binding cassette domain-containing protein [Bacteroidota bacterium]
MLEAISIVKDYKGQKALNYVSFKVNLGEVFCLVGANGAGKSTLIKLFTGQLTPTTGSANIDGYSVAGDFNAVKHKVAYIPENLMLYGHLNAIENLDLFCSVSNLKYTTNELSLFLRQAGLNEVHYSKRLENYSKGMRQKVGIAYALAKKAEYLFLDEPTSGLDPKSIIEFSEIIKQLSKTGITILMTSHDLHRSINDADKIGIMKDGNLLEVIETDDYTHSELEEKYMNYMIN